MYDYFFILVTLSIEEQIKSDQMRVNIDYIPVIRQRGTLVNLERIEIEKPHKLLSNLMDMVESRSFSILDLQARMCAHFNEDDRESISFLSPNSYYSTYVNRVHFPHFFSIDKYEAFVQDQKDKVISKNLLELEKIKQEEGDE